MTRSCQCQAHERVDRARAWEEWVEGEADSMAGLSKGSIDGCVGNRKEEQDSDGTMPDWKLKKITKTCQRVSQMTRWWRSAHNLKGQCTQHVEEANPPGPLGLVLSGGEKKTSVWWTPRGGEWA